MIVWSWELRKTHQIVREASTCLVPSGISGRSKSGQQLHDPRRDQLLLQNGPTQLRSRTVQEDNQRGAIS